jgi:hypothetical protein
MYRYVTITGLFVLFVREVKQFLWQNIDDNENRQHDLLKQSKLILISHGFCDGNATRAASREYQRPYPHSMQVNRACLQQYARNRRFQFTSKHWSWQKQFAE